MADYHERRALPFEKKVALTERKIRVFVQARMGKAYISFSGGKDSTALLHLVRSQFPDIPAVYFHTGLDYPEIVKFIRTIPDVTRIRPKKTFRQVLKEKGFPVVSKRVSSAVHSLRNKSPEERHHLLTTRLRGGGYKLPLKWNFLLDAPFKISDQCCDVMKRNPARTYERKTGRAPILGTMAEESTLRTMAYLKYGCNAFHAHVPKSTPMAFWVEDDVWQYIRTRGLKYAPIYDTGVSRTGCMFCCFGLGQEWKKMGETKFQRMKKTHPKQWNYCMTKLGIREVLDYLGVPAE
jgi:3'-phosphoadenosine 5'-phosphosulfate sulfotransferase (PAPS reductase)/FAD synthetase